MANFFVRSGATGTGTGADWPNACTNLGAVLALGSPPVAGDTIYFAHDHSYTSYGATQTWTFPSTTSSLPVKLVCVNDSTASSSYANANTPAASTIVTTPTATDAPASYGLVINGHITAQGVQFAAGSDIELNSGSIDGTQTYRHCLVSVTSTQGRCIYVSSGVSDRAKYVMFENTNVTLANNANSSLFIVGTFHWKGGTFSNTTANPTLPISRFSAGGTRILIEGVDLSAMSNTLIGPADGSQSHSIVLQRCKKHASAAISSLTAGNDIGTSIEAYSCGSSGTLKESSLFIDTALAQATSDTSIYRNTGATDATDSWSVWVKAKASSGIAQGRNFRFKLADLWWDSSKSKIRVYVGQKNGQTRLTDAKAWIEATWVRDGDPLSGHGTSHANDYGPLTAGASWTTDSGSTWTDGAATVDVLSYAEITPTDDVSGPMQVWFVLAADNSAADAEYYVDPEVELVA